MKFAKFLRTSILKNICICFKRLLLFVSPQITITNSGGKFGLDETSTEYKISIFLNVTFLFNQMQPYNLYVSLFICKFFEHFNRFQLTFLLNFFGSARFLNSNLHLVSQVATMSLRNRLAYSGNSTYCKIPCRVKDLIRLLIEMLKKLFFIFGCI